MCSGSAVSPPWERIRKHPRPLSVGARSPALTGSRRCSSLLGALCFRACHCSCERGCLSSDYLDSGSSLSLQPFPSFPNFLPPLPENLLETPPVPRRPPLLQSAKRRFVPHLEGGTPGYALKLFWKPNLGMDFLSLRSIRVPPRRSPEVFFLGAGGLRF